MNSTKEAFESELLKRQEALSNAEKQNLDRFMVKYEEHLKAYNESGTKAAAFSRGSNRTAKTKKRKKR